MSAGVERRAAARVRAVEARLARVLEGRRGIAVERVSGGLVVRGGNLRARWLREAELRWLGRWS